MHHLLPRRRTCIVSTRLSAAAAARPLSRQSSSALAEAEPKAVDTALRVLDLIAAKPNAARRCALGSHSRLIQSCVLDVLAPPHPGPSPAIPSLNPSALRDGDPVALFLELRRRGLPPDAATASGVLSLLGGRGDLTAGLQFQSLSLKTGIDGSTAVSSSLISLLSKCGRVDDARKVFDGMHIRDTVLYTSMIAAFAQHSQVGPCLLLVNNMRRSDFTPNDYTAASALSVCTEAGWLGLGRSLHGMGMRMGFGRYLHVCNALVSMYAKCGSIREAGVVFERMECRDLISWNAMISGFAQYGLAERALELLEEMVEKKVSWPDEITFLGVLSACRHAGFVEGGYRCFHSMIEHGVKPGLDHYSCLVDLLGRAGLLEQALHFIRTMPVHPNGIIWGSLLSACKVHGNVRMGILAAQSRLLLEPGCAATHLQLANLYAAIGCWNDVAEVRKLMKENGLKTSPGFSWIELGSRVYRFKAEAKTESDLNEEVDILESLDENMKGSGFALEEAFELAEVDLV